MYAFSRLVLGILLLVVPYVHAEMPSGEYLDGKDSRVGVILAHGRGGDADSNVVGPLRRAIHKELGFHTLSLQMPQLAGPEGPELMKRYAGTFPEAYQRIQAGIDFLRKEKGVQRIYLMGYSMGGRMTTGFLAEHPASGVAGYIGVGLLAGFEAPLNTNVNLKKVTLPVLDIYAENDRDAKFAENRRPMVSERFVQVPVAGARHDYKGYEHKVNEAAVAWLKAQEAGK